MTARRSVAIVITGALVATGVAVAVAFTGGGDPVPMCDRLREPGLAPCAEVINDLRKEGFDCRVDRWALPSYGLTCRATVETR